MKMGRRRNTPTARCCPLLSGVTRFRSVPRQISLTVLVVAQQGPCSALCLMTVARGCGTYLCSIAQQMTSRFKSRL